MLIKTQAGQPNERKGVILLVVISLLTLFAIVGLSFVLYANAEANASKIYREAANQNQIDMEPELLFNMFLGQLIYDVPDDYTGVYSGMRGHSLARSMYGYNYDPTKATVIANTTPFNGTGRLHTPPGYARYGTLAFKDDYELVNYTYFPPPAVDGFLRDPERLGSRTNLSSPPGQYTGGFNAPYTYPDLNNMFLAAVKADGTVLMPSFHRHWLFDVDYITNPAAPTPYLFNDYTNPNWGDPRVIGVNPPLIGLSAREAQGRYLLLRPRPVDQLLPDPNNPGHLESFPPNRPYFDYPEDPGGDVKNLPGPGYVYKDPTTGNMTYANNDSVWLDLAAPVMTAPNGTKFKALFAPLIIDLDGRVNLNFTGNVRGSNGTAPIPVADQGWGPWEVNHGSMLNLIPPTDPLLSIKQKEFTQLFLGNGTNSGRYGSAGVPSFANNSAQPGITPHVYGQVDYDGDNDGPNGNFTGQIQLPPAMQPPYTSFPAYPAGYGNGTDSSQERVVHPSLYNYFQPNANLIPQPGLVPNLTFGLSNMEALLRYGDVNSPYLTSDLFRLCPTVLSDPRFRNMFTTMSYDVDAPGVTPWAIPPVAGAPGTPPVPGSPNYFLPAAVTTVPGFPQTGTATPTKFPDIVAARAPNQQTSGEFQGLDWRAVNASLGKVNLNRFLTPYQVYNSATGTWGPGNVAQATIDRQQFAADIFIRLITVTGVYDLNNPGAIQPAGPQGSQFDALRWLAQLSANIVDFIDSDDIMTPFLWASDVLPDGTPNPAYQNYRNNQQIMAAIGAFKAAATGGMDAIGQGWVFGTELPRVVVNEAYAEYTVVPGAPMGQVTLQIDVWAELHNPFNTDQIPAAPAPIPADPTNPPGAADLAGTKGSYQVILATATGTDLMPAAQAIDTRYLRQAGNVIGSVPTTPTSSVYPAAGSPSPGPCQVVFPAGNVIPPCDGQANKGFFLVGPAAPKGKANFTMNPGMSLPAQQMSYQITVPGNNNMPTSPPATPTILLQRLANPLLAANPAPGQALRPMEPMNPYITLDYMEGGNSGTPGVPPNPTIQWQVWPSTSDPNTNSSGRAEPYAAYGAFNQAQTPQPGGQPKNSFYQVNMPAYSQFHWPVHLDRQLVSPMELLQVSAYKPHELTQQFISPNGLLPNPAPPANPPPFYYQHRAPWFDEDITGAPPQPSHLLWRLFEFLETGSRAAGMTPGTRIPGKFNINTFYDPEPFQGITSAFPAGGPNPAYYDHNSVQNIFMQLLASRSPGLASGGDGTLHPPTNSNLSPMTFTPAQPDQPFTSLASAFFSGPGDLQYPNGTGANNTLLRPSAPGQGLFQVTSVGGGPMPTPVTHPYLQDQLITKLFNNVTTRSNVFAVWVTVGFFEVIDDTARPVKLGAEIGKAENRQIRHRMFAIVDRSNLTTDASNPGTLVGPGIYISGNTNVPAGPNQTVQIDAQNANLTGNPNSITGQYDGVPWTIQGQTSTSPNFPFPGLAPGLQVILGSNLQVDVGTNQELVNVQNVNAAPNPNFPGTAMIYAFTANFTKAHSSPFAINPVNTLTAYDPIAAGPTPPTIGVSAAMNASGTALTGVFGGVPWTIQAGTRVMVDVGPTQEPAIVTQVLTPAGPGLPPRIMVQSTNPMGFQANHAPPYTISYPIPTGGNPGPQPNFNMRQVPWVVRYFSIIN